jgi:hypothetical protein
MVEKLAREPLPELSDEMSPETRPDVAPTMFVRPADVPEPLVPLRSGMDITKLHRMWSSLSPSGPAPHIATWRRVVRRGRTYVNRGLGNPDRELMADLIRSVDAVAARCDELADRLSNQHVIVADMANIFGEDLTRLRAELARTVERAPAPPSAGADRP